MSNQIKSRINKCRVASSLWKTNKSHMKLVGIFIIMFVNILIVNSAAAYSLIVEPQPSDFANHKTMNQNDLEERTSQDLLITNQPVANLKPNASSSSRLKVNDSNQTLENLIITSHNEPQLNPEGLTTTTGAPIENMRTTTLSSVDEDDTLNRLYLQASLNSNYIDDSTTSLPTIIAEELAQKADNDSVVEKWGKNTTIVTTPPMNPVETMQTSESKSAPKGSNMTTGIHIEGGDATSGAHSLQVPTKRSSNQAASSFSSTREKNFPRESPLSNWPGSNKLDNTKQEPLLTGPSLADLLYIIKHLNLVSPDSQYTSNQARQIEQQRNSNLHFHQPFPRTNFLSLDSEPARKVTPPFDQNRFLAKNELFASETSSNAKTNTNLNNNITLLVRKPEPEVEPYQDPDRAQPATVLNNDQATTAPSKSTLSKSNRFKLDNKKAHHLGTQAPLVRLAKYSLVSPYIANFDSGQAIRNMALDKLTQFVDLSADKLNSLANGRKLYERLKQHYQENAARLPQFGESVGDNRRGSNQQSSIYLSSEEASGAMKRLNANQEKQNQETSNTSVKQRVKSQVSPATTGNSRLNYNEDGSGGQFEESLNSKRDAIDGSKSKVKIMVVERDRVANSAAGQQKQQTTTPSKSQKPRKSIDEQSSDRDEIENYIRSHNSKGKRDNNQQARYAATGNNNNLDKQPGGFNDETSNNKAYHATEPSKEPKKGANNLDESPFSNFNTNSFFDSLSDGLGYQSGEDFFNIATSLAGAQNKLPFLNQLPEDTLTFDDFPGPLTFGDLTGQHGVPFRLKSPYREKYQIVGPGNFLAPNSMNQARLPMESSLEESSVFMPNAGINTASSSLPTPANYQNELPGPGPNSPTSQSSFAADEEVKLDDELKKRLAMKTIEAIAQYPELSKSLFENLYKSFSKQVAMPLDVGGGSSGSESSEWLKLYSNFLNEDADFAPLNQFPGGSSHLPAGSFASSANQLPVILPAGLHQQQHSSGSLPFQSLSSTKFDNIMSATTMNKNATSLHQLTPIGSFEPNSQSQKWALSQMPDLIPIPLAATVPGYLIRLPNGQILAAALTNSFSIQGIQKGPLSWSYKRFLNQRFKNLISKPSGYNKWGLGTSFKDRKPKKKKSSPGRLELPTFRLTV